MFHLIHAAIVRIAAPAVHLNHSRYRQFAKTGRPVQVGYDCATDRYQRLSEEFLRRARIAWMEGEQ
jgi:hypothetical protein